LRIHSWPRPSSGLIRFRGSHSRHRLIKSTNYGSGVSLSFSMIYLRRFYFSRSVITSSGAGTAVLSVLNYLKRCFRVERDSTLAFGIPITSMMSWICSRSFVPGNRGNPVNSSIMMHPKDHISIYYVYGNTPSIISGAL